MKNTSRKPYIYKVTNLETGQYYIGSQCSGKTIGHNYFTSSTNKEFWEDFKTYGEEKYKIEIIKEFDDPKECVRVENYMIRDHMQLKDGLCLNRFYCCSNKKIFSTVGTHHKGLHPSEETKHKISTSLKGMHRSEETRKKMSVTKKSQPPWSKGTHLSEEIKHKISTSRKGFHPPEETRKRLSLALKGQSPWNKGIPLSEETRKKMCIAKEEHPIWNKGVPWSEEIRQKLCIAHKRITVSIEGTFFNSLNEASKYYNVGRATIKCWVKKNQHNAFYVEK